MKQEHYDSFIRGALNVGFTDDQVDFLWNWIHAIALNPDESEIK